jgi:hypothetical protein
VTINVLLEIAARRIDDASSRYFYGEGEMDATDFVEMVDEGDDEPTTQTNSMINAARNCRRDKKEMAPGH